MNALNRSILVLTACALCLMLATPAFATGIGKDMLKRAGDTPMACASDNGVTVELNAVFSDPFSMFILYQITMPQGKTLRDDVFFQGETVLLDGQEVNSRSFREIVQQSGSEQTVLLTYTQVAPITATRASLSLKDLVTLGETQLMPFHEGAWVLEWDLAPDQSSITVTPGRAATIGGAQMTVAGVTVSSGAVYIQLEGQGPSQLAPVITLADGSTASYAVRGELSAGYTDYSSAQPKQHMISTCYFDHMIDVNTVTSVTVGDVTVPIQSQPQPAANEPSPWAAEQVSAAIAAGLVPDGLQSRYTAAVNRAEFCALAVALYETVTGKEIMERSPFQDTSDVNVEKMAALGVVTGVSDNRFAPTDPLTREQAAAMLARLADVMGTPLPTQAASYADHDRISSWAIDAVGQVQAAGIMSGVGSNEFSPGSSYTREQSIATMLRLFDLVK